MFAKNKRLTECSCVMSSCGEFIKVIKHNNIKSVEFLANIKFYSFHQLIVYRLHERLHNFQYLTIFTLKLGRLIDYNKIEYSTSIKLIWFNNLQ